MIELEESIPLARLWDLDVFNAKGNPTGVVQILIFLQELV